MAIQLVFGLLNAISILFAIVYNAKTPDLYPNNAHHKIGWIITCVVCGQIAIGLAGGITKMVKKFSAKRSSFSAGERRAFLTPILTSGDQSTSPGSPQNASPTSFVFRNSSVSTAYDEMAEDLPDPKDYDLDDYNSPRAASPIVSPDDLHKVTYPKLAVFAPSQLFKSFTLLYKVVDRIILPFGFIALTTGIITFARFFVCSRGLAPLEIQLTFV